MSNNYSLLVLLLAAIGIGLFLFRDSVFPPRLQIENQHQVVEVGESAESVRVSFLLTCRGELTVTHVETNCNCAVFNDLPIDLESGESVEVFADVDMSKSSLPVTRQFLFYVNPPVERPLATVELVLASAKNEVSSE